ncbi:hypothetical protein THAOC_23277 [Thalassiosira oceanica]|uniref:Uncharacterized protein n=1 Tax=Thalassiosira oceanica TaxID=159749 RepID=K0RSK1_THAOC|nr:hypothetical protein THAOC_23277 [Thalassiosira oceanica]|eukprot:EJK56768.1 hypothetical protein THAOC_23277 [Thalassiosira oceanica]
MRRSSLEPEGAYAVSPKAINQPSASSNRRRRLRDLEDSRARRKESLLAGHHSTRHKSSNRNESSRQSRRRYGDNAEDARSREVPDSISESRMPLETKWNGNRGQGRSTRSKRSERERRTKSRPGIEQSDVEEVMPCMMGMEIDGAGTTISSMTSTDSYVRKQNYLRELKRREFLAHSQRRRELRQRREGSMCIEDFNVQIDQDDDATRVIDFSGDDSYLPPSFNGDCDGDMVPLRTRDSRSQWNNPNKKGPNDSCRMKSSTASPVYQIEEVCIKHPHVILRDQTHVDEWTCMRYYKDETSRWQTKKMVCDECLNDMFEEGMEEDFDLPMASHHYSDHDRRAALSHGGGRRLVTDDENSHYRFSHHGERGYHHLPGADDYDDDFSAGGYDETQNCDTGDTVNVYAMNDQTPLEREAEAQRRRFIRRLAGIFFHHPLHPVTSRERFIILLGSVGVGILLSNLIYLWFVHASFGADDKVLSLGPGDTLVVTKLMVALWTLGSIWHIKACTLCRYGEHYVSDEAVKCGRTVGVTIVLSVLAFATYLVLLRASEDYLASEEYDGGGEHSENTFIHPISLDRGFRQFDFLIGYTIEFLLAVFVYNPVILTVVFSGILGMQGRIPILGGRPREVQREQKYAMKRQRYTMPQTLRLGDQEFEADHWGGKLATNF